MRNLTIELKKCKHTGILEVLPILGLLGALYAFANFTVRKDVLLNLPLPPMDVLLTQLYGMIMVLNMFGIIVATTLTYNIEFQGSAIKKMYMLPFKTSSIFKNKFYILFVLLAVCIVLQNGALCIIGNIFLPSGTFDLLTLVKYTLGIGVAGFFSGMAMSLSDIAIFLINPFVLMMKPAVASTASIDMKVLILGFVETIIFFMVGWYLGKIKHYE